MGGRWDGVRVLGPDDGLDVPGKAQARRPGPRPALTTVRRPAIPLAHAIPLPYTGPQGGMNWLPLGVVPAVVAGCPATPAPHPRPLPYPGPEGGMNWRPLVVVPAVVAGCRAAPTPGGPGHTPAGQERPWHS